MRKCAKRSPQMMEKTIEAVLDEFLNYFMIRKVICGKELKRAAGTVIKKLDKIPKLSKAAWANI